MKLGEYFVKRNYITQEILDEALLFQRHNKGQRIGEILVNMGVISKKNMTTYVTNYIVADVGDTESRLIQEKVDVLLQKTKTRK